MFFSPGVNAVAVAGVVFVAGTGVAAACAATGAACLAGAFSNNEAKREISPPWWR